MGNHMHLDSQEMILHFKKKSLVILQMSSVHIQQNLLCIFIISLHAYLSRYHLCRSYKKHSTSELSDQRGWRY